MSTATPAGEASRTARAAAAHYGIPARFADEVLAYFAGKDYDPELADVEALFERYPGRRIQLDYTFSTNRRGDDLARQLAVWGVPVEEGGRRGDSYLDIGFAYAGYMLAFARRGYRVTGVELDERYGRLGRLNLESEGCPVDARMGDFLSEEVLPSEPRFDLITCTDVIEHVQDPAAALRKICTLLKPGGMAFIAYPSKLGMCNVRSDPHAQRFGLTLLDYYRAHAAFTMYSGYPEFEVSDFYEPEWYLNGIRLAGARAELVYDGPPPVERIPKEMELLFAAYAEWAASAAERLTPFMRHEIAREFAAYSARMLREYGEHLASQSLDRFYRKWIDSPTRILITKPAG